jgi:tyrosine-protein phosphatase YwqE
MTGKTASQQLLVSIPDTCTELGRVSRTTVYDLVNRGLLTKVNIGSRGFITGDSLSAYVNSLIEESRNK